MPPPDGLRHSPTNTSTTFIREGSGQFGSARKGGAGSHGGSDIVVRQSFPDNSAYEVFAVANGTVAYARINGTVSLGFGNLIAIDHGNDCYSVYAHLASDPFSPINPGSNLLVTVGDRITTGQSIGFFVRTDADIDSTGNARRTHASARHQTHFELIEANSGRSGNGKLTDSIMAPPAKRINPESFLKTWLSVEKKR